MTSSQSSAAHPPDGKSRFPTKRTFIKGSVIIAGLGVCALVALGLALALAWPSLPDLHAMTDYHPRLPLRVYTADKVLIGEYGEEHRNVVRLADIPEVMKR